MMALPAAWFAARKRGLATGINTIGTGLGFSISGLVLPYFILQYGENGWRYAWYLMGVLTFVGAFACYVLLRDHPREKGLTMYGGDGTEGGGGGTKKLTLFSAWRDVVAEREIWKLGSVYFMYGFSYIIYLTFFVAFMTKEVGLSTKTAGGIFAVTGFLCILSGTIWGHISDILGRRHGSMLGYISLALAYLLPALSQGILSIYASAILFGITMSAIPVIMAAAAGDAVGGRLAPAGLGFITLFFGVGQAFGPAIAGWIKDTTGTFTYAFALSAGVSFLGALGSLVLKKKGQ
jgi:MFS family permease